MESRTQLTSAAIEEAERSDFVMANKMLTTNIRLQPNNHKLYMERSICHHNLGDFKASLDDANTAIRLNPDDYNIHYQKGLALIGLSRLSEAINSFKKAIELLARQDDSKLSDIWRVLRSASNELDTARRRRDLNNHRGQPESNHQARIAAAVQTLIKPTSAVQNTDNRGTNVSNDPVDSTTDRPIIQTKTSNSNLNHQNMTTSSSSISSPPVENPMKNDNNSLVTANRNNINNIQSTNSSSIQVINGNIATINRVSSSASHINHNNINNNNEHNHIYHNRPPSNISPDMSSCNVHNAPSTLGTTDLLVGNPSNHHQHIDQSKAAQFEWNIRRSERIFLHHSSEPGPALGQQFSVLTRHNEHPGPNGSPRLKTGSNPSSVHSGKSPLKRPHDSSETTLQQVAYHQNTVIKSKEDTGSHAESEIDVDDTNHNSQMAIATQSTGELANSRKRVLIAPSSSMPATSQGPSTSTSNKDDSYSSKYKRLRRDRERARRGTSKLCTIKPSDLDELHKASNPDGTKRYMRVIAPIDSWLYSGQLGIDDSNAQQYVVKLDGDATGSSYLFSQETVLNDVIKEVRVKSVSELRKGARICCYWSRQYKCLSTGVVTSRTFEATKSLVSVKYDNGDLSALPLDDLRLLPPDYPKYMSNCDPLLLAKNGDGIHVNAVVPNISQDSDRIIVDCKQNSIDTRPVNGVATKSDVTETDQNGLNVAGESSAAATFEEATNVSKPSDEVLEEKEIVVDNEDEEMKNDNDNLVLDEEEVDDDVDGAATIPPTGEVIDFITNESTLKLQDANQQASPDHVERIATTKDNITTTNDNQIDSNDSRASSEENNYLIEYCTPWTFDGPPKRTKRHGRTYRDNYPRIRRGNEIIRVGDSAELMPRDQSILPFLARIEGLWATARGEMRAKVRWYYRLDETEGEPFELKDGENALFETDHFDENDIQSIYRSTKILPWTEYSKNNLGHVNENNDKTPKIFYLAGYYDPVRRVKHLRSDVKEAH